MQPQRPPVVPRSGTRTDKGSPHASHDRRRRPCRFPARAFGVPSWRVETADGLRGALREALGAEKTALIEVMSDIGKDYPPYEFHQPRQR